MKIRFLGAAHEVTGSSTLLEINGYKILVDCGLEQGPDIYENAQLPVLPSEIDFILLTHAHIDHSGKIPYFVANGFEGKIFATIPTTRLCNIMLLDSGHIQEFEAAWRNRKAKRSGQEAYTPLYTTEDVHKTMPLFVPCDYEKETLIADEISIRFIDSGHLLGSASILITAIEGSQKRTILFSGDVGNVDRPLIKNPTKPDLADVVVIESTYGNSVHSKVIDYTSQLIRIFEDAFDRSGNVIIPSFAVGRTQELLYLIGQIKENNLIPKHEDFVVYVDSPLAVEATNIYKKDMFEFFDDETKELINSGKQILNFKDLKLAVTTDESIAINQDKRPKVIISASGMCEAGRIRHHLKHNLWRADSTVLFVGYQTQATLGRKILEGARSVKLFGEEVMVNAKIEKIEGISSHADSQMLLEWIDNITPKPEVVYVNHGNDFVCEEFASKINENLKIKTVAPFSGSSYDLITNERLESGNSQKLDKSASKKARNDSMFDKLLMAGKRLVLVIQKNKSSTNKDIAKFTDQVNELCNKWDK